MRNLSGLKRGVLGPALLSAALLISSGPALSQTSLGDQRVGTSSGTFLKIAVDARAAALGGAANAVISGPSALFINPAAILTHGINHTLWASYVQWPADIQIGGLAVTQGIPSINAQLALGVVYLSTSLDETTEYYPLGTGRSVNYSDFAASGAFSRYFTDRLAIGVAVKYLREDAGSNLGGPTTQGWLFDAGTVYTIGYRNGRLSITLGNFGADLKPDGGFASHVTGGQVAYTAFSPPTEFQLGFAIDPWLSGPHRLTLTTQVQHQADKQETFRGGMEYWLKDTYALRTGYDMASDEMGFSAGLGFKVSLGGRPGTIDYAYTSGGHLAAVNRVSLTFGF
jgi:hypothetical protein